MNLIEKLSLLDNIIYNDEDVILFFDKPNKLDNIPSIDDNFVNNKWISKMDEKDIIDYFISCQKEYERLQMFNGMILENYDCLFCDFCQTNIQLGNEYYYCYHCYSDMCKLCYEETSEEIADQNGAKNYHLRKDKLDECRSSNLFSVRKLPKLRSCDICKSNIDEYKGRFFEGDYDICYDCYEKDKSVIESKNMNFTKLESEREKYPFYYTDIGSMLYWIPIIQDTKDCRILINLNPDDKNYQKVCLQSCDDGDRIGYFILYDKKYDLDYILKMIKEITDKGTYKDDEGNLKELCSEEYSSPIQILMMNLNIPVYYGWR